MYLQLGTNRSLQKLADSLGKRSSLSLYSEWSRQDGWQAKAEAWDHQIAEERAKAEKAARIHRAAERAALNAQLEDTELQIRLNAARRLAKQLELPAGERITDRQGNVTIRQTKHGGDLLNYGRFYDLTRTWGPQSADSATAGSQEIRLVCVQPDAPKGAD